MNILGISCFYHDSAAALVIDGKLVAAASQERFSRIKHDSEFPLDAVTFCLNRGKVSIVDIDYVVFYDKPLRKFDRIITGYLASPFRSYKAFIKALPVWLRKKLWIEKIICKELSYDGRVLFLSHHLSHAAGAFFCSPFDKSAILTIDGVGEWATAAWGKGNNNKIELCKQLNYPHSVGLLYSSITYFLGFKVNSAEYKVMGLAPYGRPKYTELIEKELVKIYEDGSIHLNLKYFKFHFGLTMTGKKIEKLFGHKRREEESEITQFHQDLAASLQEVTEKIIIRMASHVKTMTGEKNLCLSGGVGLNCRANGLLKEKKIFEKIYVQPASGDAGGAVGAALYLWYELSKKDKQNQPFFKLGPSYKDSEIKNLLDEKKIVYNQFTSEELKMEFLAESLANGNIAAIFLGSAEFGPRALGFRSIVADPRSEMMKDKINSAVKFREKFRPFAPAVTQKDAQKYFHIDGESPYMLFNYQIKNEKRKLLKAVTHIDGSARVQTVKQEDNPSFYMLLIKFEQLTSLPVLLNTSFNLRGHPLVNSPVDALNTFFSSEIDFLMMEDVVISKASNDHLTENFKIEASYD